MSTRREVVLGGLTLALCPPASVPAEDAKSGAENLKVFAFVVRKNEMTHDQCVAHWLAVHGPIARRVPGVRGFVASELIDPQEVTGANAFDGVAVIWYGEPNPMERTLATAAGKAWLADGDTFIQRDRAGGVAGREHLFVAPRARDGAIKRVDFLVRRSDMSAEQFHAQCLDVQRGLAKTAVGLQGLAMTELRPATRPRFAFDTVVESWWANDRGGAREPDGLRSARSLLDAIADQDKSIRVTVRDHVFVAPHWAGATRQ
jgi:hypothetical protein